MADIPTPSPKSEAGRLHDPTPALNTVQTNMDRFLSAANVEAVYGSPVKEGASVVIPAAEVLSVAGFGVGLGGGSQRASDTENADSGGGGGGGGGGRVLARPVAAIIMSPTGVRVEPIVDVTKIALAVFTTLGFMAAMLNQMRGRKGPPKLND